jgi:Cyclic nucleotide-binding domain
MKPIRMGEGKSEAAVGQAPNATEKIWEGVRWCALAMFIVLPVFAWRMQALAGRVMWTVLIAALPLFIVLAGYHRWRRICPLAWFARLAARLGRPGARRISPRFQANYYSVVFAFFFVCLWLRLIALNGDGMVLAGFLIFAALAAFLFGAVYTGKSWCNYVCPVSLMEKVYTEPRGLRQTVNSQCEKCTACKPACPDINEENGYWKEVGSAPKRFAYFAFPGLVLSFYLYYYLQAGTWAYYFGGKWTDEPGLLRTAFQPGHNAATAGFYFLPAVPRAAAAVLTLAAGALLSFGLFCAIEGLAGRARGEAADGTALRHLLFTVAAFTAFIAFYTFAGAPTIRLLPGAPHLFQIIVVVAATLFLVRRFTRRQQAFAEETLARQIIRRWKWADVEPPKDLHEAFLIHKIRSETLASGHARVLEIYKEGVREAVASGFVSRGEVQRLESLRNQLQISLADHEKVMADLDEEERARITNTALQVTAEKRLQLETYSRALRSYLERAPQAAAAPDDAFIHHLRQEYAVTPEEHAAVLDDLLSKGQGMAPHLAEAFHVIESAGQTLQLLRAAPSPAGDFLADTLARKRTRAVDGLMRGFGCAPEDSANRPVREGLLSDDETFRETAVEALGGRVAPAIAVRLRESRREAAMAAQKRTTLPEALRRHLANADPYVRAAALFLLGECAAADPDTLKVLAGDEHPLVEETARSLLERAGRAAAPHAQGLMTLEKIFALRSVPLFASLAPQDLASLGRAGREKDFAPGEALCVEGESGDEVFVLLSGEVKVLRQVDGAPKQVGSDRAGGVIGEMAVLDPAPRAATVLAGAEGTRTLCLDGNTFRDVLGTNPSVASGVIRALAARLRGSVGRTPPPAAPSQTPDQAPAR